MRRPGERDRRKRGVPNAQVALAWLLRTAGVTAPIIGASKMSHLDDAVAALEVKLDDAELKALAEPYRPERGCHQIPVGASGVAPSASERSLRSLS